MSFRNPLVSNGGDLAFTSIHSPNFVTGSIGWSLNKDGTAEFNTVGGTVRITNQGLFIYVPSPGSGNLKFSFTTVAGTDPYGNTYHEGLFVNQLQMWGTGDGSHTVVLNPTGQIGGEILFFNAGFNASYEIRTDQTNSRILLNPTGGYDFAAEVNGKFVVTGGYQGQTTNQGGAPALNVDGAYTAYTGAQWTPVTVKCPKSETLLLNLFMRGHNASSVNASIAIGVKIDDTTAGTTVFTSSSIDDGVYWNNDGVTARANDISIDRTFVIGQDRLTGRAGHTLTFTPMWRVSSHTTAPVISAAAMSVQPTSYVMPTGNL